MSKRAGGGRIASAVWEPPAIATAAAGYSAGAEPSAAAVWGGPQPVRGQRLTGGRGGIEELCAPAAQSARSAGRICAVWMVPHAGTSRTARAAIARAGAGGARLVAMRPACAAPEVLRRHTTARRASGALLLARPLPPELHAWREPVLLFTRAPLCRARAHHRTSALKSLSSTSRSAGVSPPSPARRSSLSAPCRARSVATLRLASTVTSAATALSSAARPAKAHSIASIAASAAARAASAVGSACPLLVARAPVGADGT
eukprot:CAMPEP_0119431614 /NCGR_PEP_ID=MMETSP1335-20130426/46262_1 /TAXON_ID=259385 /ORGANISM="Chrysoculter rhomboideus, Strain RCC1486" /LENGTH=259 /DNA_ID=CAMNT_0007457419 /DNA_START=77 /DNA_END=853 /DNA_ORIENTATION=+